MSKRIWVHKTWGESVQLSPFYSLEFTDKRSSVLTIKVKLLTMKLLKLICKYVISYYIPIILVISTIIGLFYVSIKIPSMIESRILSFAVFWGMIGLILTIVFAIVKYFDHK